MNKRSKGLKVAVLVGCFGLLASYVLYAAGILHLPRMWGTTDLPGNISRIQNDSPPFKLPYLVAKSDYDTAEVVAFKALPDDAQHVLVLTIPYRKADRMRMSSTKSLAGPLYFGAWSTGADSMMIASDWKYNFGPKIHIPALYEERMWMYSSKFGPIDDQVPSEAEKRQTSMFSQLAAQLWKTVKYDNEAYRAPLKPNQNEESPLVNQPVNPNR